MSEAKKCDRCGDFYDPLTIIDIFDEWWRFELHKDCHPFPMKKIDLCSNCRKKLYMWFKEEV